MDGLLGHRMLVGRVNSLGRARVRARARARVWARTRASG